MNQQQYEKWLSLLPYPMYQGDIHTCPYLADRSAKMVYTVAQHMPPGDYQYLMDLGFRRSGNVYYSPVCDGCQACRPIRIQVDAFQPSRSQRRALSRNSDVQITVGSATYSAEKLDIYNRYQTEQHDGKTCGDEKEYCDLFCEHSESALEMNYSVDGRLVAVGFMDVCSISLSSVYFYFDPREGQRSLGVYSALMEIEECRKRNLPYWYLGFYVQGCKKMEYKNKFKPNEILSTDFVWQPLF